MTTQQSSVNTASLPGQPAFDAASIRGCGLTFAANCTGGQVIGIIKLASSNPRARRECKVGYRVPAAWRSDHHMAALRVAAHWFRDIGGFQTITHAILCHIVKCLAAGISERDIHAAVKAYAFSQWQRDNKRWTTINRFLPMMVACSNG